MHSLLTKALNQNVFPGAQAGWVNVAGESEVFCVGHESTADSALVTPETRYDTASLTKSLCTGLVAHWLVEQGRWSWDDLLVTWLPEFHGPEKNEITLGNLNSFGAPFGLTLSRLKNLSADELWDRITTASLAGPLNHEPLYINTTSILLGRAIEEATGETLPNLAQRLLWQPLGMSCTTFEPLGPVISLTPDRKQPVAPSEKDPWRGGDVRGEVHDESAWVLRTKFTAGSAGLFSTAPDVLKLLQAILKTGRGEKSELPLNQETVQSFAKNVFPSTHPGSLGWELDATWMGKVPPGTFGKTGFTGCSVVLNLEVGRAGVILSNATYPARPTDRSGLTKLRQDFSELLLL